MSGFIAPFQMKSNKVVEFRLKQNDIQEENENVSVNLRVDYKLSDIEENELYIATVDLITILDGYTENKNEVFEIQVDMQGMFTGDSNILDKNQFNEMLKLNGISTLMQLSRAYVTSATALAGFFAPINFPMINVFELIKTKENNKDIENK